MTYYKFLPVARQSYKDIKRRQSWTMALVGIAFVVMILVSSMA